MTRYMVFDWGTGHGNVDEPVVRLLGTVENLLSENDAAAKDENGWQVFGFKNVEGVAKFPEHMLQGRDRKVTFYYHYDHITGLEGGRPILALYPILTREEYDAQGHNDG